MWLEEDPVFQSLTRDIPDPATQTAYHQCLCIDMKAMVGGDDITHRIELLHTHLGKMTVSDVEAVRTEEGEQRQNFARL